MKKRAEGRGARVLPGAPEVGRFVTVEIGEWAEYRERYGLKIVSVDVHWWPPVVYVDRIGTARGIGASPIPTGG